MGNIEALRGTDNPQFRLIGVDFLSHQSARQEAYSFLESTCFLRLLAARNTTTLRGGIGTSSPVFGFRPIRSFFCRIEKLAKLGTLNGSPFARQSEISSKTVSRRLSHSFRDSPTSWCTASIKSLRLKDCWPYLSVKCFSMK